MPPTSPCHDSLLHERWIETLGKNRGRIAIIDGQIAELGRARAALDQLARSCAGRQTGPCPILSAFDPAAAP